MITENREIRKKIIVFKNPIFLEKLRKLIENLYKLIQEKLGFSETWWDDDYDTLSKIE